MVGREGEEEDGMNGAEESRGKHWVKMETARELLDLEIEIQLCFYSDREWEAGRQRESCCGEIGTITQMKQCSHSMYACILTVTSFITQYMHATWIFLCCSVWSAVCGSLNRLLCFNDTLHYRTVLQWWCVFIMLALSFSMFNLKWHNDVCWLSALSCGCLHA